MPIETSRTSPWASDASFLRRVVYPILLSIESTSSSNLFAMVLYRAETSCWVEGVVGTGVVLGWVKATQRYPIQPEKPRRAKLPRTVGIIRFLKGLGLDFALFWDMRADLLMGVLD